MTVPFLLPKKDFKYDPDTHRFNNLNLQNWISRVHQAAVYRVPILLDIAGYIWTDMPAAETEMASTLRCNATCLGSPAEFRLDRGRLTTAGVASSKLRVEYWTGTGWADLADPAGSGDVLVDNVATTAGPWATIVRAALDTDPLIITIFGVGGNGVVDPEFHHIAVEFRL